MASMRLVMYVECRLPWWLEPYLYTLAFFCELMDRDPDPEKLLRVLLWGSRWRINGGYWRRF